MAEWTHRCCERCWFDGTEWISRLDGAREEYELHEVDPIGVMEDGFYRQPVQAPDAEPGACCVCGGMTITGIFFRRDQAKLRCQGRHEVEQLGEWSRVAVSAPPAAS